MKNICIGIFFLCCMTSFCQKTDTLTFFSPAFQEVRNVYIQTPNSLKYASDSVRFPVIYVLDGQHEWFVNPVTNTVNYLQYTHEVPQALLVIIPHENRRSEAAFKELDQNLALHDFITKDLEQQIKNYNIGDHRMIIGHSFTASFALYSFLKEPDFYDAVIANTPLHGLEELVIALKNTSPALRNHIAISIGGPENGKDLYHRKRYDELKSKYPDLFDEIITFEADHATHNAVPIVSNPYILNKIYSNYKTRYDRIAEVDQNYQLKKSPESPESIVQDIKTLSKIDEDFIAPDIAALNGIASRFLNSDFEEHATRVYNLGLEYYPKFWGFHISLYQIEKEKSISSAKNHLLLAEKYLDQLDIGLNEYDEVKKFILSEKERHVWQ
ncbi:alpha/beta hydrolase [Robertkochia aurantiaca]|uniref:alpha/beta hydrolase n=1 Tax=Robertkochia aurantiaca TaxID=2873700 RepID=UPI001CCEE471|nr:alpha/beta hydrolase-fold protein [Robertkochia sp. 3YJGBD-33]